MAVTRVSDVIVPERFTAYVQQLTELKNRLVQAGIMVRSPVLDNFLAGGGLTINIPSFQDLANDDDRVGTDAATDIIPEDGSGSAPNTHGKARTSQEIAVRLNRNFSWSSMKLAAQLAGADPMASIGARVGNYWQQRQQKVLIAAATGVFADNAQATPNGTGTQNDLTVDISGVSYSAGVTDFSADAFIDALTTIGDSEQDLGTVVMHSVVYARAKKNNLIDFVADSTNPDAEKIATFLGRRVIVDDSMPNTSGVFQTWIFGQGAFQYGIGTPDVGTEIERVAKAGQGSGQEILWNRQLWCIHPTGHAYIGTAPNGGPSNAATSNNLAAAGSWSRVYPERKQIKIARLITRES